MTLLIHRLPADIRADFMSYYHSTRLDEMTAGILKLLHNDFDSMIDVNRHAKWLDYTVRRIADQYKDDPSAELQGMMYGMIFNAFEALLADYVRYLKFDDPNFFHRELEQRDAFAYLAEGCRDMFQDIQENLALIKVRDVLWLVSEVITDKKDLRIYVTDITPEMVTDILILAKSEKMESGLKKFKEDLKTGIAKYLEKKNAEIGRK